MIKDDLDVKEDDFVVRVKAQVMTKDESTGGWVPLGRGGMSIVGLRRLLIADGDDLTAEYLLHGQRIADKSVVLNCILKKDLQYTKANPTFHHWWTENQRFGLTFQSSADARMLERGVCKAMENMLTPPDCTALDTQIVDDDVFMSLNLPLGRDESWSQSASTASTAASSPLSPQSPLPPDVSPDPRSRLLDRRLPPPSSFQCFSRETHKLFASSDFDRSRSSILATPRTSESTRVMILSEHGQRCDAISEVSTEIEMMDYSYVQLAKTRSAKHDYTYPTLDVIAKVVPPPVFARSTHPTRYTSTTSLRRANFELTNLAMPPVPLPLRSRSARRDVFVTTRRLGGGGGRLGSVSRARCVYCGEVFSTDDNRCGSCRDAPDRVGQCIDGMSCVCCVQAMLYHCVQASDAEEAGGGYRHPCDCDRPTGAAGDERGGSSNCRHWTAMAILSLIVPCLWCYLPLRTCHRCALRCGCCGERHKAG